MKKSVFLAILSVILADVLLSGLSYTGISIADTSVPTIEVASREVNNYSGSTTITITMYAVADE